MRLDELGDDTCQTDAEERVDAEAMAAALRDRINELNTVAWNLPRPTPQPYPPDEAWPSAGDAA